MRYELNVVFDAEDNTYPGNAADCLVDALELIAPHMVDNVEIKLVKVGP